MYEEGLRVVREMPTIGQEECAAALQINDNLREADKTLHAELALKGTRWQTGQVGCVVGIPGGGAQTETVRLTRDRRNDAAAL